MMNEKAICELLSSLLPSGRQNRCFESDAEIIQVGGSQCLFTTDEFSAEDLFRESDPYSMGWNIAVGAISDILACGGTPLYYAHALTVDPRWDAAYLRQFGLGVRDVLNATGTRFIGGDCGRSELWRCTVSVIGACEGRPVLRRGAAPGDVIYLSGKIGAGNLEAARQLGGDKDSPTTDDLKIQFVPRPRESAIIKKHASSCIDTSDGVGSALNTLADLNGCGYRVANLPYQPAGLDYCQRHSLPKTLLFLGECGEYELLCALRPERESSFLAEAKTSGCTFYPLGVMTPGGRILVEDGREMDLTSLSVQARDFETPQHYLASLMRWLDQQPVMESRLGQEAMSWAHQPNAMEGRAPARPAAESGIRKAETLRTLRLGAKRKVFRLRAGVAGAPPSISGRFMGR